MNKKVILYIIFVANLCMSYAQRTLIEDTTINAARKNYLEKLYLKCGAAHLCFHDTRIDDSQLSAINKCLPGDCHINAFAELSFEILERTDGPVRIVVVYFIRINSDDALKFNKHTGQGEIHPSIVPTSFFGA